MYDGTVYINVNNPPILFSGVICVTGDFYITGDLTDLSGLESLQKIGGVLRVNYNTFLMNVDELSSINSAEALLVYGNSQLNDLRGLSGRVEITEANNPPYALIVASNDTLPPCFVPWLENLTGKSCSDCTNNSGAGDCSGW
ncbi:MAG: hypothetical protein JXX14_10740 [Deltaproteobacteria bacterium]|nr:hypothetical protein [Deltaproteobacteria bacterium]